MNKTMLKFKHTPGPWEIREWDIYKNSNGDLVFTIETKENVIAQTFSTKNSANAKLIASAPEMLEVLQFIVKEFPYINGISKAKEIIEKATK